MKKIIELYNKIPEIVKKIVFGILLGLLMLVSLMPVVAWIGGIAGLVILTFFVIAAVRKIKTDQNKTRFAILNSIWQSGYGRITVYIVFFGLIAHVSCRIHSELLINQLYKEALDEKKIIITNVEK